MTPGFGTSGLRDCDRTHFYWKPQRLRSGSGQPEEIDVTTNKLPSQPSRGKALRVGYGPGYGMLAHPHPDE